MSNIDLYIGGMLESSDGPGPLFRRIIRDQFERIRDADRFWFENSENGIFSPEEIQSIKETTLWDVIVNSTSIEPGQIQKKVCDGLCRNSLVSDPFRHVAGVFLDGRRSV